MATFNGTPADNVFNGTAGNDVFSYGKVSYSGDTIVAGRGHDTITSGGGFDRLVFENLPLAHFSPDRVGNDLIIGFRPTATEDGEPDAALGGVTIPDFYAADGSGLMDRVEWQDAYANCTITSGIFTVKLYTLTDVLLETNSEGSDGNDSIVGSAVTNYMEGRAGNDSLSGLAGDDGLEGGDGKDRLEGGAGDDGLEGDDGSDTLIGGAGDDTLDGDSGTDTADFSSANSGVTVHLGQFRAQGVGANSNVGVDVLYFIERVVGSAHADTLVGGGGGNVTLLGHAGNDFLTGGAGADSLVGGEGADSFDASASGTAIGGLGSDTIDGGAILDLVNYLDGNTITYANSSGAVSVNLGTGVANDGTGLLDTVRNMVVVTGSFFNDALTGSTRLQFEAFVGGAGNDTIDGGAITDTLNGRNGNRAGFNTVPAAVVVDLKAGTATGQGNDTLIDINHVRGSNLNDTLRGSNRTDVPEWFEGQNGNDFIDGRGGTDLLRYDYAGFGVSVNLAAGIASGAVGDEDTFRHIEGLRGSHFGDLLTGGHADNAELEIFRGNGGNDTIDGGAGFDRVDYVNSMQGANVRLGGSADGTARDGLPILNGQIQYAGTAGATIGTDTLRRIEAVRGSDFNDTLTGSGIASEETFEGRAGNDRIDGGAGLDRASYLLSTAGVNVTLGQTGTDGTASDGWGGSDLLRGIENVTGSRDFADRLTGNELANQLEGLGGNDTLSGGAGNDTLTGDAGQDSLVGGNGKDRLAGGAGHDTLVGGGGPDSYRFDAPLNASTNVDRLSGFVTADDRVQLDDVVFAGIGATDVLPAAAFRADRVARDASDRIVYDSSSGQLFFDADGVGGAAQVLFATVTAGTVVTASDFFIV